MPINLNDKFPCTKTVRLFPPFWLILAQLVISCSTWQPAIAAESLWDQLSLRKRVEADPNASYALTDEHGPWMILAASFSGENGKAQADDLVLELRSRYSIRAYYYGMTFKQDKLNLGRGIDHYGGTIKRRFQRGSEIVEHAVLVGGFLTIDEPSGQELLKRVKTLEPKCLTLTDGEKTSQSLATVRKFYNQQKEQLGYTTHRGPMSHALFTRNPLLPQEYFVPQGVDPDIAKWNQDLEYSLLNCPGKFSMKVATFRGWSTIKSVNDKSENKRVRKASKGDPLVIAARNAHLLTIALREKGWEAYEFHDRHESFVAVGSFEKGRHLNSGKILLSEREARIIFNTFGAHTPDNAFNRPAKEDTMLEQQHKSRFNNLLSNGLGKVADGFNPKRFVGMPFDIVPEAIVAPKITVSSSYARSTSFGSR